MNKPSEKERIDSILVRRGFFESREKAQRAIMAGEVLTANGEVIRKSGSKYDSEISLVVKEPPKYVSRGGLKLEAALANFAIDVQGKVGLDIGASTGGFTDCMLQNGAEKVYAIDVGHSQLDWKIRSDSRVVVREKLNARYLSREDIPEPVSICVIDVSFISLTLILPPAFELLSPDAVLVALIKPQFELSRQEIGKGGIVKDPLLHEKAVEKIRTFVGQSHGWNWAGVMESPILGATGNKEFLVCLKP